MEQIADKNSGYYDIERIRLILPELYAEVRHRRDDVLKIMTRYSAFCGISIGWVVAVDNPISFRARCAVAGILAILGLMVVATIQLHARTYAATARIIVKISDSLGLFGTLYPDGWRDWGNRVAWWPGLGIIIIGLATCIFLILYG